jgi:3-oxoacyl-(acyl-carrier-protein) synthase
MGAAAPTDVAIGLRALAERQLPPVANLDEPAAGFDLDFVVGSTRTDVDIDSAVVISRGMGGVNACLVLKRWPTSR